MPPRFDSRRCPPAPALTDRVGFEGEPAPHVLVVGDTVAALAAAIVFERAGASITVLTRHGGSPSTTGAVTLTPAALSMLTTIDRTDRIEPAATSITEATVCTDDGGTEAVTLTSAGSRSTPSTVDRGRLLDVLRQNLDSPVRQGQEIDHLSDEGDGVRVTDQHDEPRWVDLVVGADGPNSFVRTMTGTATSSPAGLHEWTFRVDRPAWWSAGLVEGWTRHALATVVPMGDELGVCLGVHVPAGRSSDPRERAEQALMSFDGRVGRLLEQHLPPDAVFRWLPDPSVDPVFRAGRVAFCGEAATPVGYLSGLTPALGLEDALVLAETVTTVEPMDAALDRYETCRERRLARLRGSTRAAPPHEQHYPPQSRSGPLGRIAALRTVGFGGLLDRTEREPGR
ncbi:FAD-dependent oxidoreductase [Haloarchaeobius amylolyticus]|uniref:FAD-dependent oxidoreductase n=1 Tax=Haloarchaeobius amylolyticus TaxID=1198296 RepID=UPI0022717175|nr:NAD(P)/FAD-dependent oxidoreductase [Haloarchaeobius amylolyticus]